MQQNEGTEPSLGFEAVSRVAYEISLWHDWTPLCPVDPLQSRICGIHALSSLWNNKRGEVEEISTVCKDHIQN